jgi:MoxR-like ATPase
MESKDVATNRVNTTSLNSHRLTDELSISRNPNKYVLSSYDGTLGGTGLKICTDAPEHIVPVDKSLISTALSGDASTKRELYRTLKSDNVCPMLIGDAGTGKNTAIDSIYSDIDQPVYRIQCNNGMTTQDLIAQTELVDGHTITTLKPAGLAAIFGGCLVLDEINLANSRITAVVNSMTEEIGKRRIEIPTVGTTLSDLDENESWDKEEHLGRYIHPRFRIVATRNPSTYKGARKINSALNDRFSPILFKYMGVDTEAEKIANEFDVEKKDVLPLVETVQNEIREARKNNCGPSCPVSYRRLVDTVEYSQFHETTLYDAAIENIVRYAQSEHDRKYIKSALRDCRNKLSIIVGNDNMRGKEVRCFCGFTSTLNNSSKALTKSGICPICELPTLEFQKRNGQNEPMGYIHNDSERVRDSSAESLDCFTYYIWDSIDSALAVLIGSVLMRYPQADKDDFDGIYNGIWTNSLFEPDSFYELWRELDQRYSDTCQCIVISGFD